MDKKLNIPVVFAIIIIIIIACGCMFHNQKTGIHDTVIVEKIIYPYGDLVIQPAGEDGEKILKNDVEVIYACANVTSTPSESILYVRWHNIYGDNKVIEDYHVIECGAGCCWHCFNITKPESGWKAGNYNVDFYIPGSEDVSAHVEFKIVENHDNENIKLKLNYNVSECNEFLENMSEEVDISLDSEIIKINHDLPYVCCANVTLHLEQDENIIKVIETNIGEVCRCSCMYYVDAEIINLKNNLQKGEYIIELWGVKKDEYPQHYRKIYTEKIIYPENKVCMKDRCFYVELAVKEDEITRGLMSRENLDPDKGMLFIFKEENTYQFWMKNTLIPLDIIWINEYNEVVFISKNSQPCKPGICPLITPGKKALYVLELNGGVSDNIGLVVGDKIMFDINF